LLRQVDGAADIVLENVVSGTFQIPFQLSRDCVSVKRILRKYPARPIDLADACLIHLADALQTGDILTLDSDFEIYRWSGNKPFRRLIPDRSRS
jgi:predicted nucleic acid-binding protein